MLLLACCRDRYKCLQTAGAAGQPGGSMPWNPFSPAQDKPPAGITSSPQIGPLPETLVHGPFMRFGGYDPTSSAYYVSVLVVAHQSKGTKPPTLKFRDINVPRCVPGVLCGVTRPSGSGVWCLRPGFAESTGLGVWTHWTLHAAVGVKRRPRLSRLCGCSSTHQPTTLGPSRLQNGPVDAKQYDEAA